ncbi:hypothetical protein AAFF_G00360170 [Aldrovandia affinis]|uniref:Secreted protein n=1 Tax=Aldrovandia affinis TaxID=143900 RepID=A0AAD7SKD0_9TELE|nr:hypothetical protein AAFF_G00360170 [Aldrovandia affinis]
MTSSLLSGVALNLLCFPALVTSIQIVPTARTLASISAPTRLGHATDRSRGPPKRRSIIPSRPVGPATLQQGKKSTPSSGNKDLRPWMRCGRSRLLTRAAQLNRAPPVPDGWMLTLSDYARGYDTGPRDGT